MWWGGQLQSQYAEIQGLSICKWRYRRKKYHIYNFGSKNQVTGNQWNKVNKEFIQINLWIPVKKQKTQESEIYSLFMN